MLLFLNVPLHDENDAKFVINNLEINMYIPMLEVTAGGGGAPVFPTESAPGKTTQARFDFYYNESCLALS